MFALLTVLSLAGLLWAIDEQVYRLYLPAPRLRQAGGLKPEEIKIVEEGVK